MIRMDVYHDSERGSRDFRQIHAAFFSNGHLFFCSCVCVCI